MLSSLLKEIVGQKKEEDNYKGERIYIRVTESEKEMIEKLASIEKRSVSNFIRHLVYVHLNNFIKKV